MNQPALVKVTDKEGQSGLVIETSESQAMVRLEGGKTVLVPRDILIAQKDGNYYLNLSLNELEHHQHSDQQAIPADSTVTVVPVIKEEVKVGKRQVDTGYVQIKKVVHDREEVVDIPLFKEKIEIKRVRVDRIVAEPSGIRYESNTTVIPLYEEVLVVEKRLMLTEELHITKRQVETRNPQRVTLRREEAVTERKDLQQQDKTQ